MKRVLIVGDNSYVGASTKHWLEQWPDDFSVDVMSGLDDSWKQVDFSNYDSLFYVAELAHNRETRKNKNIYARAAYEHLVRVSNRAKGLVVKQFVFLSTMAVFGVDDGRITRSTPTNPKTNFAIWKLKAEEHLKSLESPEFKVAIIRPPMVYGHGSRGNYNRLSKLARFLPFFPDYPNKRSMLHIDNLCELLNFIIDLKKDGMFYPQNNEYARTSEVALKIATIHNKNIRLVSGFNPIIKLLIGKIGIITTAFGSLHYEPFMSEAGYDYRIRRFEESIERTEKDIPIELKYWHY